MGVFLCVIIYMSKIKRIQKKSYAIVPSSKYLTRDQVGTNFILSSLTSDPNSVISDVKYVACLKI